MFTDVWIFVWIFSCYNLFFQCCKTFFTRCWVFKPRLTSRWNFFFPGLNYGRKLAPYKSSSPHSLTIADDLHTKEISMPHRPSGIHFAPPKDYLTIKVKSKSISEKPPYFCFNIMPLVQCLFNIFFHYAVYSCRAVS